MTPKPGRVHRRRAYPGASRHTGFRRPDPLPAVRPEEVEPWPPEGASGGRVHAFAERDFEDYISPPAPSHPKPAVHKPGWVWNGELGQWQPGPPPPPPDLDRPLHPDRMLLEGGASRPAAKADAAPGLGRNSRAAGSEESDGPTESIEEPPGGGAPDGRFPWKLHDPDTGGPSSVDPSTGEDLGWPETRFHPPHNAVLADPRTGEPVRDPDGYPYSTAPNSQRRLRERVKNILDTPPDQMTDAQLDALHEAMTVQRLLFGEPPGAEGGLGAGNPTGPQEDGDDFGLGEEPKHPSEDEAPDMEGGTPEETPEDPRGPPPLVPNQGPNDRREPKPAPRPAPLPTPGRGGLLKFLLRSLSQTHLWEADAKPVKRQRGGRRRRGR